MYTVYDAITFSLVLFLSVVSILCVQRFCSLSERNLNPKAACLKRREEEREQTSSRSDSGADVPRKVGGSTTSMARMVGSLGSPVDKLSSNSIGSPKETDYLVSPVSSM